MTRDLDKRELGAFYTRLDVAGLLADWAIRSKSDKILEPSFGGCTFLRASFDRLRTLGSRDPAHQLWGFDVDQKAFDYLKNDLKISPTSMNFLRADYLTSALQPGFDSFDVVFGNPPYVAHEILNKEKRVLYRRLASARGFEIPGKASLWVYFVLFSLSQLRPGGRIAWILPWSILTSVPGKYVQEIVRTRFLNMALFPVEDQLFECQGTRERTVILLADTYSPSKKRQCEVLLKYCSGKEDLSKNIDRTRWLKKLEVLDPLEKTERSISTIEAAGSFRPLSDFLDIRIGIVTGNSDTFVITKERSKSLGLRADQVRRCIKRLGYTNSLIVDDDEFARIERQGKPSRLLVLKKGGLINSRLRNYLYKKIDNDERSENRTYRKRSPWYAIEPGKVPDGFIKFFGQEGLAFVINEAKVVATNSCYIAFLRDRDRASERLAVISLLMLSTFGQAFFELRAGRYGPGALKAGVRQLAQLPIPVVSEKRMGAALVVLKNVNREYSAGKRVEARRLADKWVVEIIKNKDAYESLRDSFEHCRARRLGLEEI